MKRSEPTYLVVGHLNKVHGTKGELFVWSLTDYPESVFAPGVILYLGDESGALDPVAAPTVALEGVRPFRQGYLLKLEGVETRTEAEHLAGRYLLRPMEEVEALEEGEVFYHQLLGMTVRTKEGEDVGEIVEVYELAPADLLAVRGPGGLKHIPFLRSLVVELDPDAGVMVIDPPKGLLDL